MTVLQFTHTTVAAMLPFRPGAPRSHMQGAAWAKDPRPGGGDYLFQLQAVETGPGDVETILVHRYRLKGDTLTYLDTMTGVRFGHCQTLKVRISALGNPYVWLGLEVYDTSNRTVGTRVHRVRYRSRVVAWHDKDVRRVWVASASSYVAPVDCPDWTVSTRTPQAGGTERFDWYSEKALLAATQAKPAKPARSLVVRKITNDSYQSSAVTGTYSKPGNVYRLTGALAQNTALQETTQAGNVSAAILNNRLPGTDPEEAESVLSVRGELWVGKQTSPASRRQLGFLRVTW